MFGSHSVTKINDHMTILFLSFLQNVWQSQCYEDQRPRDHPPCSALSAVQVSEAVCLSRTQVSYCDGQVTCIPTMLCSYLQSERDVAPW